MKFANEYIDFPGKTKIAGVDEAGRGALAGPVCVASVILSRKNKIEGLNDSKLLSFRKREYLFDKIIEKAFAWKIKLLNSSFVDEVNVLNATLFGMKFTIENLNHIPDLSLIDGNKIPPNMDYEVKSIIKGDLIYSCIAAASILAKVSRDRYMCELDKKFPMYGFKNHKGYFTKEHKIAINRFGICPEHRKSYKPIKQLLINFNV